MEKATQNKSLSIAEQWLGQFSYSAATWNLDAHMALISHDIQVLGLPKGGIIDYAGFRRRRFNEFSKKLLVSLTYKGLMLLHSDTELITFAVKETVKSSRGESYLVDKEMKLRKEGDGKWRAVQETIKYITRK